MFIAHSKWKVKYKRGEESWTLLAALGRALWPLQRWRRPMEQPLPLQTSGNWELSGGRGETSSAKGLIPLFASPLLFLNNEK